MAEFSVWSYLLEQRRSFELAYKMATKTEECKKGFFQGKRFSENVYMHVLGVLLNCLERIPERQKQKPLLDETLATKLILIEN